MVTLKSIVSRSRSKPSSPVEPEKDKVSLVVEGGHLPTHELRALREECSEHPANAVAQTCRKVVEDYLWMMLSWIFASSLQREN